MEVRDRSPQLSSRVFAAADNYENLTKKYAHTTGTSESGVYGNMTERRRNIRLTKLPKR